MRIRMCDRAVPGSVAPLRANQFRQARYALYRAWSKPCPVFNGLTAQALGGFPVANRGARALRRRPRCLIRQLDRQPFVRSTFEAETELPRTSLAGLLGGPVTLRPIARRSR
jgi:hypothetical protein